MHHMTYSIDEFDTLCQISSLEFDTMCQIQGCNLTHRVKYQVFDSYLTQCVKLTLGFDTLCQIPGMQFDTTCQIRR